MRALVGVCALAAPRYVRTSLIAHAGIGPRRRHCAPLASLARSAPAGDGTIAGSGGGDCSREQHDTYGRQVVPQNAGALAQFASAVGPAQ